MSKLDELRRLAGANVDDSMGVNRVPKPGETASSSGSAPARWQGVSKSRNAAEVPTDKIQPDPDQPREHFDEEGIERLAESIQARGLLQPIRVRWDEGRGVYVIICGERRWRAAVRAGLPTLSCVVMEGAIDQAELLALQLIENALREDLRPVEQAKAFRALMDGRGWTARQVARELHYPQSTLVKILELLELPEAVQDRVERGELPVTTAYELRKIEDPAEQVTIAERIAAEDLTREEAGEIIRRSSSRSASRGKAKGRGARARKVTRRTFRTPAGRVTVENGRGLDAAMVLAAVEDVANQVRVEVGEGRGDAAA